MGQVWVEGELRYLAAHSVCECETLTLHTAYRTARRESLGEGHNMGKGLEVGVSLLCSRSCKEARVSLDWGAQRGVHRALAQSPGL